MDIKEFEEKLGGCFLYDFQDIREYKGNIIVALDDDEVIGKSFIEEVQFNDCDFLITVKHDTLFLMVWEK